jgi:hypothetical protein
MDKDMMDFLSGKYPVQVTDHPCARHELHNWVKHFKSQGVEIKLMCDHRGRYTLWRELTQEEVDGIESGELNLSRNYLTKKCSQQGGENT